MGTYLSAFACRDPGMDSEFSLAIFRDDTNPSTKFVGGFDPLLIAAWKRLHESVLIKAKIVSKQSNWWLATIALVLLSLIISLWTPLFQLSGMSLVEMRLDYVLMIISFDYFTNTKYIQQIII